MTRRVRAAFIDYLKTMLYLAWGYLAVVGAITLYEDSTHRLSWWLPLLMAIGGLIGSYAQYQLDDVAPSDGGDMSAAESD